MERIIKNTGKILGILFLLTALVTCKDPTNLLEGLEDEVKMANDLYLEIVDISVEDNEDAFDPGSSIEITFDREIDMEVLTDYLNLVDVNGSPFVSASENKSLEYAFNTTNNVLTITPIPYLDGLINYELMIESGLKGTDDSYLRDSKTLSFRTLNTPRGYIEMQTEYTGGPGGTDVLLTVYSQGALAYQVSEDEDFNGEVWKNITTNIMTDVPATVTNSEGVQNVYIRFKDTEPVKDGNISGVESASVTVDNTGPSITVSALNNFIYENAAGSLPTVVGSVTDSSSGVNASSYVWARDSGLDVDSFGSQGTLSTTVDIDNTINGSVNVVLTAEDILGNSTTSAPFTLYLDTVAPTSAPVIGSSESYPSTDTSPEYSLSGSGLVNFQYSIDGGTWETFNGSYITASYGVSTVEFRGADAALNWSSNTTPGPATMLIYPKSIYDFRLRTYIPQVYPANRAKSTGRSDLAWTHASSLLNVNYKVYFATTEAGLSSATPILTTDPAIDSSSVGYPHLIIPGTEFWWKVDVYSKTFLQGTYGPMSFTY